MGGTQRRLPQARGAPGAERGFWPGFAWLSAALLLNAALITFIGSSLSCTLCFVLAVRGLRSADHQDLPGPSCGRGELLRDAAIGLVISRPVYWMFTGNCWPSACLG